MERNKSVSIARLHEDCLAKIISKTSPVDACRLSPVSPFFQSVADSDLVWQSFFPSDYQSIVSRQSKADVDALSQFDAASTKKSLFLRLCRRPLLIDNDKKSFWLDQRSRKKCYMLAARDLFIEWGYDTRYWFWRGHQKSRFPEVAELKHVWWLEIRGKINTSMLSLGTRYAAYLVFMFRERFKGFDCAAEASFGVAGSGNNTSTVCLHPPALVAVLQQHYDDEGSVIYSEVNHLRGLQRPRTRSDGWLEIKLGDYYISEKDEDGEELEMSVMEVKAGILRYGLIVQGIEIRPCVG